MKKVGISTVFTGYNYGSALQAYATKYLLKQMGYNGVIIKLSGSMVKGRDVRLKKIAAIAAKAVFKPSGAKGGIGAYYKALSADYPTETKEAFEKFTYNYLEPQVISLHSLKKQARGVEYSAFICGSDQIWNADAYYVDPFYYLRYAPECKRIAFAPSFGRSRLPEYNKKIISEYISGIPFLSVREESGAEIIKDITGRKAEVLTDPTLALSASEWEEQFGLYSIVNVDYLLAYFLSEPSREIKKEIRKFARERGLKIIGIPYLFKNDSFIDELYFGGPKEFLSLVKNAAMVCTDSFHGTAFSLNFGVPFYTFERNYGTAGSQSTRIISLLKMTDTTDRYYKGGALVDLKTEFDRVSEVLKTERERSAEYLSRVLKEVSENG